MSHSLSPVLVYSLKPFSASDPMNQRYVLIICSTLVLVLVYFFLTFRTLVWGSMSTQLSFDLFVEQCRLYFLRCRRPSCLRKHQQTATQRTALFMDPRGRGGCVYWDKAGGKEAGSANKSLNPWAHRASVQVSVWLFFFPLIGIWKLVWTLPKVFRSLVVVNQCEEEERRREKWRMCYPVDIKRFPIMLGIKRKSQKWELKPSIVLNTFTQTHGW